MHSHGAVRLGGELELLLVKASQMERWVKCQTALGQKEMFILIYPDTWNCDVLVINHSPAVGVIGTPDSKKAKKGKLRQGRDLHKLLLWCFIRAVFTRCVLTQLRGSRKLRLLCFPKLLLRKRLIKWLCYYSRSCSLRTQPAAIRQASATGRDFHCPAV